MSQGRVKVVAVTKTVDPSIPASTPEEFITYVARVSNPANQQLNECPEKLISYCLKKGHWSVFEQVYVTVEIITYDAVSMQILRHKSFTFQQFSQRYANVNQLAESELAIPEPRRQDLKNRQNTIPDMTDDVKTEWTRRCQEVQATTQAAYDWAVQQGIGKECARFVLPKMTPTKLYMTGSIRSFIHYIQARCDPATQKEHRDIALMIRTELSKIVPTVAKCMDWPSVS